MAALSGLHLQAWLSGECVNWVPVRRSAASFQKHTEAHLSSSNQIQESRVSPSWPLDLLPDGLVKPEPGEDLQHRGEGSPA